jgi:chromosome segregation ATPase
MFGRTRRENRQMHAEIDLLKRQLRTARLNCGEERREREEWAKRAERIGDDRIATARQLTAQRLEQMVATCRADEWSGIAVDQAELFGRAMRVGATRARRLRRAVADRDRQIAALHARLAAQEDQLARLQSANERHYQDLAARPASVRARSRKFEVAS